MNLLAANQYKFRVEGQPIAQPRPRFRKFIRKGVTINKQEMMKLNDQQIKAQILSAVLTSTYTPYNHKVNEYRTSIRKVVFNGGVWPISGPLQVDVIFLMERPQKIIWKTKPMPRIWDERKPDIENLYKPVLDALQGIVYDNDSHVVKANLEKWICGGNESPKTEITITKLEE